MRVCEEARGIKAENSCNDWTTLGKAFSIGERTNRTVWCFVCRCICGKVQVVTAEALKKGQSKSCRVCGYKKIETHGETGSRLWGIWKGMMKRCCDPNDKDYKNYGGRGITICQEWLDDHAKFFTWARANGYGEDKQIHRPENDDRYSPTNGVWLTKAEHDKIKHVRK